MVLILRDMPLCFVRPSTENLLNANSSESVNMSALFFQLKLVQKLHITGSKISSENYLNRKKSGK